MLPAKLLQPELPLTASVGSSKVTVIVVPATSACSAPAGPKETTRKGRPDAPPVTVLSAGGATITPPAPAGTKRIVPPVPIWLMNSSLPWKKWIAAALSCCRNS